MEPQLFDISVCICSHNPRRDYFARVLEGLARQSLDNNAWELLIIDNQSREPLAGWVDLSAFRQARIVSEPQLGLTAARVRGIAEARGAMVIFVDDDNILDADYLTNAGAIMRAKPFLGAIGGRCRPCFEAPPPRWLKHYLPYLAAGDHGDKIKWIHHKGSYQSWYPYGAGLVIRRDLAQTYVRQIEEQPERKKLDRKGNSLTSAGDIDMILTCMDEGYATGYFPTLRLQHLIPPQRVSLTYLRRMIYHANYSLYHLMLTRRLNFHPRPWPLAYLFCVALCLVSRQWHPLTWFLACFAAHGRYAAYQDFQHDHPDWNLRKPAPRPSA